MATIGLNTTDPALLTPATGKQTVIANRDLVNPIIIGDQVGIFAAQASGVEGGIFTDPTVTIIDPGGYILVDGTWAVYGLAVTGDDVVVSVTQSALALLAGPATIAEAIVDSGLATAIASATANALANVPEPLYNLGSSAVTGGNGMFGCTIQHSAPGTTLEIESNTWESNAVVGRKIQSRKLYFTDTFPTAMSQLNSDDASAVQFCVDNPARLVVCFKPQFNPPLASEKAAMVASLNFFKTTVGNIACTLYQEPTVKKNNISASQYIALVQFHANTDANGTGLRTVCPLAYDGLGFDPGSASAYYPGSAYIDIIATDYYGTDHKNGKLLDPWTALDPTKPYGVWEMGNSVGPSSMMQSDVIAYIQYVTSVALSLLNAGRNLDAFMWYQNGDPSTSGGANIISTNTDFRVPLLQQLADTVTGGQPNSFTIAAGATKTLPPLFPSPGGGFAVADNNSYDLMLKPIAGAASTNPFGSLYLRWINDDNNGARSYQEERWAYPLGANGTLGTTIRGTGPQEGRFLLAQINNHDTDTMTVTFQLNSTGRVKETHQLQWNAPSSVAVPGFNLPGGANYAGSLGSVRNQVVTPGAGNAYSFLLSLFNGPVYVSLYQVGVTNSNCLLTLSLLPTDNWGANNNLFNDTADQFPNGFMINFPRTPVLATITNNGTVNLTANANFVPRYY